MSKSSTALLILVAIIVFTIVPPTGEFFAILLKKLSLAGLVAIAAFVILLVLRGPRE